MIILWELERMNEYYLVFSRGEHLVRKFLKKRFGHVFLITHDNYNWIKLNPAYDKFDWEILPLTREESPVEKFYAKQPCIYIKMKKKAQWFWFHFKIIQCVSMVKYVLGIKLWGITPWQFYKSLVDLSKHSEKWPAYGIENLKILY